MRSARTRRASRLAALAAVLLTGCGAASSAGPALTVPATVTASPPPVAIDPGTADSGVSPDTAEPAPGPTPSVAPSGPFGTDEVVLTDGATRIPLAVWVADTPELRARGLMGRTSLADGTGMVFRYTDDHTGSFWMRDTRVPLSIAFAGADGVIHTVKDMDPCTQTPCERYPADAPYRTALEVPQGWFTQQGVATGWRLEDVADA